MFLKEQPDVNWQNPEVRQAQLDVFRFWLERGVDGFRLDVFNAYFKHPGLEDNPTKFGLRRFDKQIHVNDMDRPEMMPLLGELRDPAGFVPGAVFRGRAVHSHDREDRPVRRRGEAAHRLSFLL